MIINREEAVIFYKMMECLYLKDLYNIEFRQMFNAENNYKSIIS